MKKDEFKDFIKKNPVLISFVKTNEMTWQKFYELYDLYGEDSSIWDKYLNNTNSNNNITNSLSKGFALGEFINWLKSVDLDGLQEGIGNVQRVLGVVTDLTKKDATKSQDIAYKPRPLYRHFED